MYNHSTIKSSLSGLVGWRQNDDPGGAQLTSLLTSSSGLWFSDAHPLLTISNLESIAPDFGKFTYAAWNSGTAYAVGDIVTKTNVTYRATASSTNKTPPDTDYWEVYDDFTEWLRDQTEAGIVDTIADWFNRKFRQRSIASLIERERLYDVTGSNEDDITNEAGKLVGIEFEVHRSRNAKAKLLEVSLQLTTNQSLTISLWRTGDANAVKTTTLAYTGSGDRQWFTLTDWELEGEGAYILAYEMNDLTGNAINGAYDRTANRAGYYKKCTRYFKFMPFKVDIVAGGVGTDIIENTLVVGGGNIFNTKNMEYTPSVNYGLNLSVNVVCDYTTFIVEQKDLFAKAVQLRVAMTLLRQMAYNASARLNRSENNLNTEQILYEIDGNPTGRNTGLGKDYEDALNGVQFDTTGVDKLCLPCRKRGGVKYTTV
jgi:hypothetical protein